ncbi:hypothetical protein [Simplicispira lacusdiani]|uniref:hypothetical protein n=1 Tax=Simplicispira lacusdiani TaxID=2213010 RepID=UPI001300591B|nr:hypothetical protein [Simplicispira lacusdiani]
MNLNPLSLLLTVLGGLVVAALLGWIRKPRLVVLVPRTFSYSQITERGQLVEISVFNRSFKTEESIDVTLSPTMSYEMLGANSQDVAVEKNRIKISRIAPSDEVTTLLIVEGGVFKADDINQTTSKETKGIVVSKVEDVSPTGPQRIGLVAFFIGFPLALYAGYLGLNSSLKAPQFSPISMASESANSAIKPPKQWIVPEYYRRTSPKLFEAFDSEKINIEIAESQRKSDLLTIPFKIENNTEKIIKTTIDMTTADSEKKIRSYERRISDIVVLPGTKQERSLKVVVPLNADNAAQKIVFIDAFLETSDGETLSIKREYIAKK